MLTHEKVLKVFGPYLDADPDYEVVKTSRGYTLLAWNNRREEWFSAEFCKTPEDLRDALLSARWGCRLWQPGCLERSRACGMQSRTAFIGERAARIWYNRNMERWWQHGSQQQSLPGLRQENETAVHRLAAL